MDKDDDRALLAQLNVRIGAAETSGKPVDRDWLDGVLAPQFAFRRATGAVVDRKAYLAAVAPSEPRETDIESILLYGDRAFVSCIVTLRESNGEEPKYHNARLFIKGESGWQLLGWANASV